MAKVTFHLTPTAAFRSQLEVGVSKGASQLWLNRIQQRASTIGNEVGNLLSAKFNLSLVARALRGQSAEDLPAHFGLTDTQAHGLVEGMANLIKGSVHFEIGIRYNRGFLRIQAVKRDWAAYLALPGAQYVSSPSNITIPVMRWLLMDPTIDIGQAAYDIVFSGENASLDARIQKVSRSGRAIMVSLEQLGGDGGYVLPSIIAGNLGENFIEYTLGRDRTASEVAQIVMKKVV